MTTTSNSRTSRTAALVAVASLAAVAAAAAAVAVRRRRRRHRHHRAVAETLARADVAEAINLLKQMRGSSEIFLRQTDGQIEQVAVFLLAGIRAGQVVTAANIVRRPRGGEFTEKLVEIPPKFFVKALGGRAEFHAIEGNYTLASECLRFARETKADMLAVSAGQQLDGGGGDEEGQGRLRLRSRSTSSAAAALADESRYVISHKYLDEQCPDRTLRTYEAMVKYERDVVESLLRRGIRVRRSTDGQRRLQVDGPDDHEPWDLPSDIALFDKTVLLVVGPGCKSFPGSIRYMTQIMHVELTGCDENFTIPDIVKNSSWWVQSLGLSSCNMRVMSQFIRPVLATRNDTLITLTKCFFGDEDDDYVIPYSHGECRFGNKVNLILEDCTDVIKTFFHLWMVDSVSFYHTPFRDADEEQTYVNNLVNALASLREEREGDEYGFYKICSFLTMVRKVVPGLVRFGPNEYTFSNENYCAIFCAIYRTFPNVDVYGCDPGEMVIHLPRLPIVAPEGLGMLASRIKTIREMEDPSFAKNIQAFYIPEEKLFNSLEGMKVGVGLAQVFKHALNFAEFNPKLAELRNTDERVRAGRDRSRQRKRQTPEVQAVINSNEYQKLQMKLRFILNDMLSFKKPKPSDPSDGTVFGTFHLFVAAVNRMDHFRDADYLKGFVEKDEKDFGRDEAMEIRNSLTYHILRDGLSTRDEWYSYLR